MTQILYSNLTDQILAETLAGFWQLSLADRTAFPAHPALIQLPDVNGSGSVVQKVPQIGLLGYDKMATRTEVQAVATTALTDASSTITVGRYSKNYSASDIARVVDAHGVINAQMMSMDALVTFSATLRSLLAGLVGNFATTVGASGVNATLENVLDAVAALEIAAVEGPYLGCIHPRQWHDIVKDAALNSGGAIQFSQSASNMVEAMKGLGYKGQALGVDWYTTLDVTSDGTNRAGGIFGRGALGWAAGPIPIDPELPQAAVGPYVMLEKDRTPTTASTAWVMHSNVGVGELIDLCGVSLITDA